jgi:hypothetical protein
MNPNTADTLKTLLSDFSGWLSRSFDKTAAWVTQLSWWKFFIFAILLMAAGAILQDTIFTSEESIVVSKSPSKKSKKNSHTIEGDANIDIDETGIRIRKPGGDGKGKQIEIDENGVRVLTEPEAINSSGMPATPAAPAIPATPAQPGAHEIRTGDDIHIKLPPEVAREISNEINNAVADAADEEV